LRLRYSRSSLLVVGFQAANPHSYVAEAIARIGESGSGGGGISWDAYYLYGRDATWKVEPESLASSGGSVIGSSSDLAAAFASIVQIT
jgi:hypothetical protein